MGSRRDVSADACSECTGLGKGRGMGTLGRKTRMIRVRAICAECTPDEERSRPTSDQYPSGAGLPSARHDHRRACLPRLAMYQCTQASTTRRHQWHAQGGQGEGDGNDYSPSPYPLPPSRKHTLHIWIIKYVINGLKNHCNWTTLSTKANCGHLVSMTPK